MNLKTKKRLDHLVGRPALALINALAWVLGRLLRIDHARLPVRTVVVAKFQGIGSLIMAKPALARLRKRHPAARLVFWGTPSTAALARLCPEFDEVAVLDDSSAPAAAFSLAKALIRFWRDRPDWLFDLEPYSNLSAVLSTLSCARNRAGFVLNVVRVRRYAYSHLVFLNRYRYLGDAYARLLGLAGPEEDAEPRDFGAWKLAPGPAALEGAYAVVNIHAGDLSLERRWPKASFEKLIDSLLAMDPALRVALIGHGAFETAETALLARRPRVVDLSGKLSLEETLRLVGGAALVVSGDSAPLHMATSFPGVPLLGLYGPTRPQTYFCPWREKAVALSIDIYCSPCVHHWDPAPCAGDNQCLKRLSPATAARACAGLLGRAAPAAADVDAPAPSVEYYPGLLYHNRYW